MTVEAVDYILEDAEIPGFENYRIWKDGRIVRTTRGTGYKQRDIPITGHSSGNSRTPQIHLSKDGRSRRVSLSRLMLEVWPKPYPVELTARDILRVSFYDGDSANCRWDNLYWTTHRNISRKNYISKVGIEFLNDPIKIQNIEEDFAMTFPNLIECAKYVGRDPVEVLDLADEQLDDCDWLYEWR